MTDIIKYMYVIDTADPYEIIHTHFVRLAWLCNLVLIDQILFH